MNIHKKNNIFSFKKLTETMNILSDIILCIHILRILDENVPECLISGIIYIYGVSTVDRTLVGLFGELLATLFILLDTDGAMVFTDITLCVFVRMRVKSCFT